MEAASAINREADGSAPRRRAAILTARLGIAQAILTLAAYWLLAQAPGIGVSDEEILEFYNSDQRWAGIVAGLYLMPFAGIAFLWFVVALRMWIQASSREDALLSNVQLVSAIVFIGLFFAAAGAESCWRSASIRWEPSPKCRWHASFRSTAPRCSSCLR